MIFPPDPGFGAGMNIDASLIPAFKAGPGLEQYEVIAEPEIGITEEVE